MHGHRVCLLRSWSFSHLRSANCCWRSVTELVIEERAVELVVSLLWTLAMGGLFRCWMWSLMMATVVARVVSNSRSFAAEVARLMRGSRYSGGGWVSLGWWWIATLLVKLACLVVQSWSRSRRWARWKCVLKVVQVLSLLGLAFQALQSSKYNPVLKTRVYTMRRSWSAVYGWLLSSA